MMNGITVHVIVNSVVTAVVTILTALGIINGV